MIDLDDVGCSPRDSMKNRWPLEGRLACLMDWAASTTLCSFSWCCAVRLAYCVVPLYVQTPQIVLLRLVLMHLPQTFMLGTILEKGACLIGIPSTTFNVHFFSQRCTVDAVLPICKMDSICSPGLLWQHPQTQHLCHQDGLRQ